MNEKALRVAVIGAGMSGILAAIKLRDAGYDDIVVYERAGKVGGTWHYNTYPGLTCDVPSHVYRYSFAPNPDWSRHFSPGPEIQAYFENVAREYNVGERIRFNAEIVGAQYDSGQWRLETKAGDRDTFDCVIAATGVLRDPRYPDIEGLGSFDGPCFHSARWDHSVSLDGKRVGLIGNGSTGVQIVGAVVDRVASLTLFQRTAQWIMAMPNDAFTDEQKDGFRRSPDLMQSIYVNLNRRFVETFGRAVLGDEDGLKEIEDNCRQNLEDNVADLELRRKLTPNYRAACKRLVVSNEFYPAISRPNADVVIDGIERIEANGVRTKNGVLHELDVLVLATGFYPHNFMRPMNIVGQDGVRLNDLWARTARAHRTIAIPGFPNFFMVIGPNSPFGNFPLIQVSEAQLDYILQLMRPLREGRARGVQPTETAMAAFNESLKDSMHGTIWQTGCKSWYLDADGWPALWPWTFDKFEQDMAAPVMSEYELVA
jgi:cation diffusion facilitator CzcD-associated flavoprotein CzcO